MTHPYYTRLTTGTPGGLLLPILVSRLGHLGVCSYPSACPHNPLNPTLRLNPTPPLDPRYYVVGHQLKTPYTPDVATDLHPGITHEKLLWRRWTAAGCKNGSAVASCGLTDAVPVLWPAQVGVHGRACELIHSLARSHPLARALSLSLPLPLPHSLTHSLTHSRTHPLTHPPTHSLPPSLPHSLTHSRTHSHSPTRSLTHVPTYPPTLTHSFTHLLTTKPWV